jgi:hypothetical protein
MRSLWILGCVAFTGVARANHAPTPPPDPSQDAAPAPPPGAHEATAPVQATPAPIAASSILVAPPPRLAPPSSVPALVPPPGDRDETEPSYRVHMVVADLIALGLAVTTTKAGVVAGTSIFLFDGLVIHGSHDHLGRGIGSVALRAGLPVVATIVGRAIWWSRQDPRCRRGDSDFCADDEFNVGALYGLGLGLLGAMVIDTAFLARPATVHRRPAVTWSPRVSATREQVAFGITGGF